MKKSNLVTGIVYLLIGIGCSLGVLLANTRFQGLPGGFAGAGIASGGLISANNFIGQNEKEEYSEKITTGTNQIA